MLDDIALRLVTASDQHEAKTYNQKPETCPHIIPPTSAKLKEGYLLPIIHRPSWPCNAPFTEQCTVPRKGRKPGWESAVGPSTPRPTVFSEQDRQLDQTRKWGYNGRKFIRFPLRSKGGAIRDRLMADYPC